MHHFHTNGFVDGPWERHPTMGGVDFVLPFSLEMTLMKRLLTWVCLLGFLAGVVGQAAAEDKKPEKKKRDPEAIFKKLDTDGNGTLSEQEFVGKKKDKAAERAKALYAKLNTKKDDGGLTLDEFKARGKKKPKKKKDE